MDDLTRFPLVNAFQLFLLFRCSVANGRRKCQQTHDHTVSYSVRREQLLLVKSAIEISGINVCGLKLHICFISLVLRCLRMKLLLSAAVFLQQSHTKVYIGKGILLAVYILLPAGIVLGEGQQRENYYDLSR